MEKTRRNRWKGLFITLFIINLSIICYISWMLNTGPTDDIVIDQQEVETSIFFNVSTNKKTLNTFVNNYLEQELGYTSLPYTINLQESVELMGEVPLFSKNVQFLLQLEPNVMENGDLLLRLISIRLGQLHLPVPLVLASIKELYQFPEWVVIYPNKEEIYIGVTQIRPRNGSTIKVETFDLQRDKISFRLYMPEEGRK